MQETSTKAKRPDRLKLLIPTASTGFPSVLIHSPMSACQENVVQEHRIEAVELVEELPSSVSTPGIVGQRRMVFTFPPVADNQPDVMKSTPKAGCGKAEIFTLKTSPCFSGTQLLSCLTRSLQSGSVNNKAPSTTDTIIQTLCTQLLELEVLEPVSPNSSYSSRTEGSQSNGKHKFKLTENYRWSKVESFYTPNQTPSNMNEDKIKKLRLHNKHLKSRLANLTEQLNRLELQTQSKASTNFECRERLGTKPTLPCQIEVRSEGKSSTSVSMPSTVLSISTFNEGSGSHVSLSFSEPEYNLPGYITFPKTKTPSKSFSSTPRSCDSYKTATELTPGQHSVNSDNDYPPNQTHLDQEDKSSKFSQCASDSLSSDQQSHKRRKEQSQDAATLCHNCQQLISVRNRLSNASIDSGLSQSYSSSFPANNMTDNTIAAGIEPRELPLSQSTPAFSTDFNNAYGPNTPEGFVNHQNADNRSEVLTNHSEGDISIASDISDEKPVTTHAVAAPLPPPPPIFGSFLSHTMPRRKMLKPRVNLRPIHWQRILLQNKAFGSSQHIPKHSTVWDKLQEPKVDADELEELFAIDADKEKATSIPSPMLTLRRKNFTKVLDRKRSQNLGIILSSIRQPFSEIKKALLSLDVSFLTIDTWRSLYDARATEKELTEIQDQVETNPKCVLDKPEQFLYNLNSMSFGLERIRCFLLRNEFEEEIKDMTSQLCNMATVCDHMTTSPLIENLLSLLLAVGNYLNGGSKVRGQADGFSLDILPKLKDIRGKKQTSLLRYIAGKFRSLYGGDRRRVEIPLPSHATLISVSIVNYSELSKQVASLQSRLQECEGLLVKVKSTLAEQSVNEKFYDVMSLFVQESKATTNDIALRVEDSQAKFGQMCQFYSAPNSNWQNITPTQFFEPWITLSKDLTQVWELKGPPPFHSRVSAYF